jgi:hypothetical protein
LRLERALRANHASGVPRPPLPYYRVELWISHLVLLLAETAGRRIRGFVLAGGVAATDHPSEALRVDPGRCAFGVKTGKWGIR